jgi:cytoskeletal protein CcmA (bactofilin family)
MFGSEKRVPREAVNSFLAEGTRFQGSIDARGDLQIDGHVEGFVQGTGCVLIGETAIVNAEVRAREAIVAGRLRGAVIGRERVELLRGSRLEGDVHASSFKIEDGAYFHGNCIMGEPEEPPAARPEAADGARPRD